MVQAGMLYDMELELQKGFVNMSAYEIITVLKTDFAPKAMVERYKTLELFMTTNMDEHGRISEHVVKVFDCIQHLNALEYDIPGELAIDRVLHSPPLAIMRFS